MFSAAFLEFLNRIRQHEIDLLCRLLPAGARVLEIGAGTGSQALALEQRGFSVAAVDRASSEYAGARVFGVIDYDGRSLPFSDAQFDVVFSSSVLEHVEHLQALFVEMRRVLRPGGMALHVMPTPAWRFWTTLGGWADLPRFLLSVLAHPLARTPTELAKGLAGRLLPFRHGTRGTGVTELWHFRERRWLDEFARGGFTVCASMPMGLFYTGWLVLGRRLPLDARERLSGKLGSACRAFVMKPS